MPVRLFDISHWNATADFAVAKAAGYVGVYLKATQGTGYVDPTFAPRVKEARKAGLHVGAYHFLEPDQPVAEQIDLFHRAAGDGLCDLRPVLDHETAPAGMTAAAIAHQAAVVAAGIQSRFAVAPLVYTYRSFISEGYCAGLGAFPLWIADYSAGVKEPGVPGVWHDWALWQTGQAHVPGVAGGDGPATDVNVARDLAPLLAYPPKPTPPKPADSPLLHLGSSGPKVTDVQHALDLCDPRNLTAHTDGLGKFRERTEEVLVRFQRNRGLAATGTTTIETWAALRTVAHRAATGVGMTGH